MLAVKLHKKKQPYLGAHSFLIPILSWETGKVYIKNWIKTLNTANQNRPNNEINYITLIRIADKHPVSLFDDWCHAWPDEWSAWKDIPDPDKQAIMQWREEGVWKSRAGKTEKDGFDMSCEYPEIIIAEKIPNSCILWTKDIRLLYYGNRKRDNSK